MGISGVPVKKSEANFSWVLSKELFYEENWCSDSL